MKHLSAIKRLLLQILVLSLISIRLSSFAEAGNFMSMTSPKLRQFLLEHPEASKLLTNVLSEAFSTRNVHLYYFYSDEESAYDAFHYYPNESEVGICIKENQQPLDEFLTITYESFNSEGEKQFQALCEKAESGEITRTNFALEIFKVEFKAVNRIRDSLSKIKCSDREIASSYHYKRFMESPDKFEDFITYTAKMSPHGSPIEDYKLKYDWLRNQFLEKGGK